VKSDQPWHECLTIKNQKNSLFINEYWVIQDRKRAHPGAFPF